MRMIDRLPPRFAMRLRVEKNRRNLFGLHGPAKLLTDMVPSGSIAVDVGAARGLYSEWMAKKARQVQAFEANPDVYDVLEKSSAKSVVCHNVALSNQPGKATLHIPKSGLGEASLMQHRGRGEELRRHVVETRTLDSYMFDGVGFLKIDVEGHEESVLEGAFETLRRCQPVVFLESEERHNPGAIARIRELLVEEFRYQQPEYMLGGRFYPYETFDVEAHQARYEHTPSDVRYVSNFLYRPCR